MMNDEHLLMRNDNNARLRNELLNQIHQLNPNWHITLTWHTNSRTRSVETLNHRVKECMAAFERAALGRNWFRKHYPFIMVAERHADGTLHAHIVLHASEYDKERLERLFYMSERVDYTSWPEVYITPICDKTGTYILKQIKPDYSGSIDTSAWICSDILLELNYKKKRHRVKGYQKHNIKTYNHITIPTIELYSSRGQA